MKKASDILCALSVIVAIFVAVCNFNGCFGYTEPNPFLGFVILASLLIGIVLRVDLEDSSPVAAGVITLVFISTGGFGLISAILLFVYAGVQSSISPFVTSTASANSLLLSNSNHQAIMKDFKERYESLMNRRRLKYLSEEEFEKRNE